MSKTYVLGVVANKTGLSSNQIANFKTRLHFINKMLGPEGTIQMWLPLEDIDVAGSGPVRSVFDLRMPVEGVVVQTLPGRPFAQRSNIPEYIYLFNQLEGLGCDEIWCLPSARSAAALSRSSVSRLYHHGIGQAANAKARVFKLLHPDTLPDDPAEKVKAKPKGVPRK